MRVKIELVQGMNVIGLAKYQKTSEKLLYCAYCKNDFIDIVPDTFPLEKYPCDNCGKSGDVYQAYDRTIQEE